MSVSVAVDTAKTFSVLIYMGCEVKADFNTGEAQRNAAGLLKWGVTIPAESDPCDGLAPGTPVRLDGLRAGVMDPEQRGEKIRGGKMFFQAQSVVAMVQAARS